jgi:hypothetical protein
MMPVQPKGQTGAFAATLRPFQRRLRKSLFVRTCFVASAFAIAAVDVICLILRQEAVVAILGLIGAFAFSLLLSWAIAVARTPSLSETARVIDRHARLDDRAVTALQFAPDGDAVSRLIVDEATMRLEATPVSTLPAQLSPRWRWTAVGVLAVSALIVIGLGQVNARPSSVVSFEESTASSSAADRSNTRHGSSRAVQATDVTAGAAQQTDAPPIDARKLNGAEGSSTPGTARTAVERTAAEQATVSGDRDQLDRAGSASLQRAEVATTSRGTSDSSRAAGVDASRTGTGPLSAGGRGAQGITRDSTGGGGVSGGALTPGNAGPFPAPPPMSTALHATDYRGAYARAEAAMARERVPPRLRSYVRDYFLAIRKQPPQ